MGHRVAFATPCPLLRPEVGHPCPSPRPRLRAAEDTFSVGKGDMQDTLSPGKGDIHDTLCAGKGGVNDTFYGNPPPATSSGLVVQPRQALGDPVADPAELFWLLTAPDHS